MIQVVNGKVVSYELPKVGTLSTGESVSGYHMLPKETLKREGWLPLEDRRPEYNKKTETLQFVGYELLEDKAVKEYKIIGKYSETDILKERLDATEEVLMQILMEGV